VYYCLCSSTLLVTEASQESHRLQLKLACNGLRGKFYGQLTVDLSVYLGPASDCRLL
jgi:hypothetical protein